MCGFTFTVFLSAFQLLPTAPFHILDLGGSTFASGLFLGFLTFSSAFSAPVTGALADRFGQRRVLIITSLALAAFSVGYAVIVNYRVILVLVILHGIFWSGLLSASSSYMTHLLPESRRAEGIGYWGLSSVGALAVAPTVGLWIYRRGWIWLCVVGIVLNLAMAVIAWRLREHTRARVGEEESRRTARVARADHFPQPVPVFVRLRRHHQFYRPLRRRERRRTQEHLPDHDGDRDPRDASVLGPARRPSRLQTRVRPVPDPHQPRDGAAGGVRHDVHG